LGCAFGVVGRDLEEQDLMEYISYDLDLDGGDSNKALKAL
jgi:hypothetical protein